MCDNQNTYLVTLSSLFISPTVYPKKYAHGFCFVVLCCGYTLTDFPISIRLTSLALWQSNDCPSASKATLMNTDKYFMWIHYERLHNHNKAKHNKTVCIFLGIYCTVLCVFWSLLCVVFFRLTCELLNITFIIGRSRTQTVCGDTCQIWMQCKESRYFGRIETFVYGEIKL